MKTQKTKDMEKALINDALHKGKHPALEVPYYHTTNIGGDIYRPVGKNEYIDAVIEEQGLFTCLELKVSITDLHSNATQTYFGNKNYMVCPISMAHKIKQNNDPWLINTPLLELSVGMEKILSKWLDVAK